MKTNLTLRIERDENPINPRGDDNLGKMICFHREYDLGDMNTDILDADDFASWHEQEKYLTKEGYIFLPLYLYDHSGITMNTTGFSCGWDSGQVGWIVVHKSQIKKEYNAKIISKQLKEKVLHCLHSEVKIYDNYLKGEIYGYVIEEDGETIESCWGFDDEKYAEEEGKSMLRFLMLSEEKKKQQRLKNMIKHKVPLEVRVNVLSQGV